MKLVSTFFELFKRIKNLAQIWLWRWCSSQHALFLYWQSEFKSPWCLLILEFFWKEQKLRSRREFFILKNAYPERNGASANHYPPPQQPNTEKGANKPHLENGANVHPTPRGHLTSKILNCSRKDCPPTCPRPRPSSASTQRRGRWRPDDRWVGNWNRRI